MQHCKACKAVSHTIIMLSDKGDCRSLNEKHEGQPNPGLSCPSSTAVTKVVLRTSLDCVAEYLPFLTNSAPVCLNVLLLRRRSSILRRCRLIAATQLLSCRIWYQTERTSVHHNAFTGVFATGRDHKRKIEAGAFLLGVCSLCVLP